MAAASAAANGRAGSALLWFRKGLRLHDNPALHAACAGAPPAVYPVFVLDPWFLRPDPAAPSPGSSRVGVNRIGFLLQSLADLDASLAARGSRLLLLHGDPTKVLPDLFQKWHISKLCFEFDTEPYACDRDAKIRELAREAGVEVVDPVGHTLCDPRETIQKAGGTAPTSYGPFCKAVGKPADPIGDAPEVIPAPPPDLAGVPVVPVPTLADLGYDHIDDENETPFKGGETEGLRRLDKFMSRKEWVARFEKPKGNPAEFDEPATTFGCVSSRLFYKRLMEISNELGGKHTQPPVSLEGQLLWREFFYTVGYGTPHFDRMTGNPICKKIGWKEDEDLLAAWRDGQTGYPWIDACMTQLRKWGWMHHLARHAVACFLTRGDLYVHWEKGRDVFDRLLIDGDWSINNGNWMWLSASAFFHQYHRIYSPVTFGQKYDKAGKFVKFFIPVLKDMPPQYIYEPWKAPMEVQKKANCIIGKDYPHPVVDHGEANKKCRDRMAAAYKLNKETKNAPSEEQLLALRHGLDDDPDEDPKENAREGVDRRPPRRSAQVPGRDMSKDKGDKKRQRRLTDYG
eukprot:SM000233S07981  [mRNA]  locus=s233:104774:108110:+ [translate_table: standard]